MRAANPAGIECIACVFAYAGNFRMRAAPRLSGDCLAMKLTLDCRGSMTMFVTAAFFRLQTSDTNNEQMRILGTPGTRECCLRGGRD